MPVVILADSGSFYPPVDPKAPFTPTVTALVAALTVDEKIALVHWATDPHSLGQAGYNPGVPRLGIPPRRDADALGINVTANATALPARLGLGATFDRNILYSVGQLEGNEGRALGVDLMYGPQTDLTRLPNWGRNNTTWGEDPALNGNLAIAEVEGIQSKGLMSEVKHFAFYNGQNGAGFGTAGPPSLPTIVDDQTAHELYLKAYEYPITQAAPSSIMCSYQGFEVEPLMTEGEWASDCSLTLTTILRGQWKFPGFVLSDYGAVHSVDALLAGLDMEYATTYFATDLPALADPTSSTYNYLYAQALDNAVAYVIYADERFGLLTGTSGKGSGFKQSPRPNINTIKNEDAVTTEEASEEAAVLLQNEGSLLPLTSPNLGSVAVIGPTAAQVMVYGGQGERARGFPDRDAINPLQMLQKLAPKGSNFMYSPGIDWIGTLVSASELPGGLTRTESDSSATQVDSTIDYGATSDLKPGVTYTWTGTFNVPSSDTYYLYLQGSIAGGGGFPGGTPAESITIDGATPTSFDPAVPVSTYPSSILPTGGSNTGFIATLTGGPHKIVITAAVPSTQTTPVFLRFAASQLSVTISAAVNVAAKAKIAVVFADDNGAANSNIVNSLSANQDALIEAVAQANPNTVVVLSTGDPVLAPWASSVKGILEMWYPGQEGGTSTARLLLGLANPGGKLPISWPASAEQTPFANHPERITGDGTAVYFSEGIFNGYRWYDQQGITPLFSFGHGLSYTTFGYSNIKIRSSKDGVDVSFTLKNNGAVTGSEVPQVYLGPPAKRLPEVTQYAPLKLAGFERIQLDPDQSTTVQIHLDNLELSYWSPPAQQWVLATGSRKVYVGAASDDIRLQGSASVRR
jgi:beta-glucosidase